MGGGWAVAAAVVAVTETSRPASGVAVAVHRYKATSRYVAISSRLHLTTSPSHIAASPFLTFLLSIHLGFFLCFVTAGDVTCVKANGSVT